MATMAKKKTHTVRFDVSRDDGEVIADIAHRAHGLSIKHGLKDSSLMDWSMDITAAHRNGCPLRLRELIAADDFNFSHDVFGIRRYLNRETGELGSCFVPRYAVQ